ncbi:exosome 3'-_5 exonuclease subunit ski4 (Csl4) [Rhizina undulata]
MTPAPTLPRTAIPGQPLANTSTYTPGVGVHVFEGRICASVVGQVVVFPPGSSVAANAATGTPSVAGGVGAGVAKGTLPVLTVQRPIGVQSVREGGDAEGLLPEVGATVLARVTRINPRLATVAIFVIGETVCEEEFQGVIRVQDVRATEKDKVRIFSSFRPGDIVRAQVISLGDQSNYYLSTASNSLGVVVAHSESGDLLHPLNWRQMASSRTGVIEERKVAKPI